MSALVLEIRKHRRSRLPWLLLGLGTLETLWLCGVVAMGASRSPVGIRALQTSTLYDHLLFQSVLLGPTIAFLASRVAGVDQDGRMGQLLRAVGQSSRRQFLVKLTFLTGLGTLITTVMFLAVVTVGHRSGLADSPSYGSAFWLVAILSFTSVLAISAVQLALAHLISNTAGSVVIGIIGSLIVSFLPYLHLPHLGWLLPWGLPVAGTPFPLITPEIQAATDFPLVSNPGLGIALSGVAALAWVILSTWLVVRTEENS